MGKDNKQRLFEVMGKLDPTFKPKLNENAFNDAGEPNMTHQQFKDYSEPAEPEYNDNAPNFRTGDVGVDRIDWKVVYEILVANSEGKQDYNISDLTDSQEGLMSMDELIRLKDNVGSVWFDDRTDVYPFFDVPDGSNIPTYEEFLSQVKSKWDDFPTDIDYRNDNEAPYMRGREPMSEENLNQDKTLLNMFIASLPDNFPELVRQHANNKNIGLDAAYYQYIGAFSEKFEKNNAIEFILSDDDLEKIPTLMYGRFGDNAIEF